MDYKELVERLKRRESDMLINHPMTAQACRDAATAITDLLSRAEAAEAHCKRLNEYRENANEAAAKWEGMYYMAEARAEKAERERDEARQDCTVAERNHEIEVGRRQSAEARAEKSEQLLSRVQVERLTIRKSDFAFPRRGSDAVSVLQCVDRLTDIEDILGDDYDLSQLKELVEAEKDGRCVVLPCNPGDFVWVITERGSKCVERWIVHRVYKRDVGGWYFDLKNMMLSQKRPNEFEMCKKAVSSFGKTVFLTREAAGEALKGEQNG